LKQRARKKRWSSRIANCCRHASNPDRRSLSQMCPRMPRRAEVLFPDRLVQMAPSPECLDCGRAGDDLAAFLRALIMVMIGLGDSDRDGLAAGTRTASRDPTSRSISQLIVIEVLKSAHGVRSHVSEVQSVTRLVCTCTCTCTRHSFRLTVRVRSSSCVDDEKDPEANKDATRADDELEATSTKDAKDATDSADASSR
jgi:hypothetical protein